MVETAELLSGFGGLTQNDLNNILDHVDKDDPEELLSYKSSMYVDMDGLNKYLQTKDNFTLLSLNIQSIHAKFEEFKIIIDQLGLSGRKINAICLQETWLDENSDTNRLLIDGYNFISQPKSCSSHGGLAIYLRDDLSYSEISMIPKSDLWENQIINISGPSLTSTITICNVYRPPRNNDSNRVISNFLSEYSILVDQLSKSANECAIAGDFNINLLQLNERDIFNEYFDLMVGCGFFPHITLPTRFSKRSCTLIDQIFVKEKLNESSGTSVILFSNLSDHLPCISSIGTTLKPISTSKVIMKRKIDQNSLNNFYQGVSNMDLPSICHSNIDMTIMK